MRWTRTPDDGRGSTGAVYRSGPWVITKSFYADGPSMFEWILTNTENRSVHQTYPKLRTAKARAEHFDEHGFVDDQPQ